MKHIVKSSDDYSECTGCSSCEMMCALFHDGAVGPELNRIYVDPAPFKYVHYEIYTCEQCDDTPCFDACPKKGSAMYKDDRGIVCINEDECIGCGVCQRACKLEPSRINLVKTKDKALRKAKKCDLCKDRKEGPICIEQCPAQCLAISDNTPWDEEVE